ncbi:unnamed protein product [Triticum turgidum subsp. durum]|uniref:Gb protein n=2 Tax=Triticum TaxID=4564 RepID=A0A9R1BKC4_TRITD|nr:unnamed protein product [Triticum turgidum subsp. durum]
MGTREVYEEKLRSGAHLHRDPTINPGLGSARCPRCLSLLNPATSSVRTPQPPFPPSPDSSSSICPAVRSDRMFVLFAWTAAQGGRDWAITSVLHDATAVTGSGAGAMLSAVHGFNTGIPFVQKHVKGPKWLHLLVGVPPLILFSGASALFGAYALPTFAQLTVTSYYAASSASHYAVSQITRHIEKAHLSGAPDEKA